MYLRIAIISAVVIALLGAAGYVAWLQSSNASLRVESVETERDAARGDADALTRRTETNRAVRVAPASAVKEELLEWSL